MPHVRIEAATGQQLKRGKSDYCSEKGKILFYLNCLKNNLIFKISQKLTRNGRQELCGWHQIRVELGRLRIEGHSGSCRGQSGGSDGTIRDGLPISGHSIHCTHRGAILGLCPFGGCQVGVAAGLEKLVMIGGAQLELKSGRTFGGCAIAFLTQIQGIFLCQFHFKSIGPTNYPKLSQKQT